MVLLLLQAESVTTFNKAIAGAVAAAVPAYAAFTTSCSGVFAVFGTNGTGAEIAAAGFIGLIAAAAVYFTPNKPTVTVTK